MHEKWLYYFRQSFRFKQNIEYITLGRINFSLKESNAIYRNWRRKISIQQSEGERLKIIIFRHVFIDSVNRNLYGKYSETLNFKF